MPSTVGYALIVVILVTSWQHAESRNCTANNDCQNGGTCPNTTRPCVCGGTFSGDTCADACTFNGTECQNGGTCITNTTNSCTCAGNYSGLQCHDACTADSHCLNGGTCNTTATPNSCICAGAYTGNQCEDGSGAESTTILTVFLVLCLMVVYSIL